MVRVVTVWRVALGSVLIGIAAIGCSDDKDPVASSTSEAEVTSTTTTSSAPERPASTTTTAYDPAAVEGQVEAAYLRSWDVYAEAVYNLELDEDALAEVYAERALDLQVGEIKDRIAERRASYVRVEHDYEVILVNADTAHVVDAFRNHQVRIDAQTKAPVEPDPNELLTYNFQMKLVGGIWRVALIERLPL
jgi:hypothetical protein